MPLNDYGLFSGTPPKKMGFAEAAGNNIFVPSSTASNKKIGFAEAAGNNTFTPYADKVTTPMSFSGAAQQGGLLDDSNWWNDDIDLTYSGGGFTDTEDDRFKQNADNLAAIAASNSNNTRPTSTYNPSSGGGGGGGAQVPQSTAQPLRPQDLSQRALSGSYYSPDMSAYNDSSLFNYTGPGGVDEYTYGQGLPTDGAGYNIWGTPADMVNPYYEGQFAQAPTGVADNAINMSPVVTPEGIPDVSGPTTFPNFTPTKAPDGITPRPGGLGLTPQQAAQAMSQAGKDLTYQQTIDEMGIFGPNNPPPSTTFPSPGNSPSNVIGNGITPEMIAQSTAMDNQLMSQSVFDPSDPRGGEKELNKDAQKYNLLGAANPQGGLPNPYRDRDGMSYNPATGNVEPTTGFTDTADDRFRPAGAPDAQLERRVAAGMNDNLSKLIQNGQDMQARFDASTAGIPFNQSENAFQNTDTEAAAYKDALDKQNYQTQINNPTADFSGYMRNYGSGFSEPQASLSDVSDATPMQLAGNSTLGATKDGVKTGPSGTTAIDANNKSLDKMIEQNNLPWRDRKNTSLFSSPNLIDIALRYASGGDVTQNAIAAHRSNKDGDYGDGLKSYKDENLQKLDGSLYQPVSDATDGYHFRSGKDAGKLSGSQNLNLGGLPMAAGSWLYQQANGLLDGTVGSNANKQSIDNMQGLIASGNAPALKSLFDNYEAGKVRETKMNESIADGTFKPGVKAPVEAARKAEAAKSAKEKAAQAKVKSEALAKAKASDIRSKAAAKAKSEAAAKAKKEAEAKAAAKRVSVNYNRNKPTPVVKSKPTRTPAPKPTRSTGSRGGRGNVAKKKSAPSKSYSSYSRRVGGR